MKRGRPRGSMKRGPKRDEILAANVDLVRMLKGVGVTGKTGAAVALQDGVSIAALRVPAEVFEQWRRENGIPEGRWLTKEEIAKGTADGIMDGLTIPAAKRTKPDSEGGNVRSIITRYYRAPNRRKRA